MDGMNHEEAFAEEAREEVRDQESRQRRRPQKGHVHIATAEDASESENESSPLIGSAQSMRGERRQHKRGHSYQKAINEPWTGAHGQGDRPWYKKPSVRDKRNIVPREVVTNSPIGVLAPSIVLPFLYCIWRNNRTEDLPHTRPDMSRPTVRPFDKGPYLYVFSDPTWGRKSPM